MADRHAGRTVVVVGLGNIGSHVVPHVARMPDVAQVVLVDKGRYEDGNLATQAITPGESGRGKSQVQALRLRRIRPALAVASVGMAVEDVPLGRLRADAILACVDSRSARLYLNQAARHLGVPLVDAGVLADGQLARVSTFLPEAGQACLECSWDQRDYDAVEHTYPCRPGGSSASDPPSTSAPAELGALAAALQVIECRRLLDGADTEPAGSRDVVLDARTNRMLVSRFSRNDGCRLQPHAPWRICRLRQAPEELALDEVLAFGARSLADVEAARLELDGVPFVTALTCLACGRETPRLRLRRALTDRDRACKSCGGRLEASAMQMRAALGQREAREGAGTRSLRSLGLEAGDVFAIRRGDEIRHYELAWEERRSAGQGEAR